MSRFTFVVAATLLALAVSESTVETELEESYSPEQVHAEAQQSIDALLQLGKKDSACRKLASGTTKEITDSQRSTQKLINQMDVGKNCDTAGLSAFNAAKGRENSAYKAYQSAKNACNKAKGARVQVGAKSLSQFKVGCSAFLNDAKFIKAKRHMTNTCNTAMKKKAAYNDSRKVTASALKAHKKAKHTCACRAQKNHKAATKSANNFNSAANAKAWTKAHHMMCVLDGKPANKCAVPRVPRVSTPGMPSWVAKTDCVTPRYLSCRPVDYAMTGGSRTDFNYKVGDPKKPWTLMGGGISDTDASWNSRSGKFGGAYPAGNTGNTFFCDIGDGRHQLCMARYCRKEGMKCTTDYKDHRGSGNVMVKPSKPGYTMTGGGIYNNYRHFNKAGMFVRSNPAGNEAWVGNMGLGWGNFRTYVRSCTGVRCVTRHNGHRHQGWSYASCPRGYQVTSCGMWNMRRSWSSDALVNQFAFRKKGEACHCRINNGKGGQMCFARCCK